MAATIDTISAISLRSPRGEFRNTAHIDFTNPENARAMREALRQVHAQLGTEYDLVIGGRVSRTKGESKSLSPAKPSEVVGIHQKAGAEHVEPAMQAALHAFESWRTTSWEERASLLLNASAIIQSRRLEFNAWMVYEVGKNWVEADADTGETIDFLEFYAREALRLSRVQTPVQLPGERDELLYIPLGVGAVIPPWNFPFAIMAGMTSAAIVCGNTVILKPSSDSPTIAAKFVDILRSVGVPKGVVNFVPGDGGEIGDYIVDHSQIRFISFTGSAGV